MNNSSPSLKKTMGDRFRLLREKLGLTQKDLAKQLGMPITSISTIETRGQLPTIPMVIDLVKIYRLSPLWLLTGEGEMILPGLEAAPDRVELLKKAFPKVPAEPDVLELIECLATPILKSALILKSLELKELYKAQGRKTEGEKVRG